MPVEKQPGGNGSGPSQVVSVANAPSRRHWPHISLTPPHINVGDFADKTLKNVVKITTIPTVLKAYQTMAETEAEQRLGRRIILQNAEEIADLASFVTEIEQNSQSLAIVKSQLAIAPGQSIIEWVSDGNNPQRKFRQLQSAIARISETHDIIREEEQQRSAAVQAAGRIMAPARHTVALGEAAELLAPELEQATQNLENFNGKMEASLAPRRETVKLRGESIKLSAVEHTQDALEKAASISGKVAGTGGGITGGAVLTGLVAVGSAGQQTEIVSKRFPVQMAGVLLGETAYAIMYFGNVAPEVVQQLHAWGFLVLPAVGALGLSALKGIGEGVVDAVTHRTPNAPATQGHGQQGPGQRHP